MSAIPWVVGGIGAAAVAGGVGYGMTKLGDANVAKEPTGTKADATNTLSLVGVGVVGAGLGVAGMMALRSGKGPAALAVAAAALGAGALIGSIGAAIAGNVRHGTSVDTLANGVLDNYDRWPQNGSLDLRGTFWNPPESYRTSTSTYDDPQGNTYYDTSVYSTAHLAETADARGNRDGKADLAEVRAIIQSKDADGDGRLKGAEATAFEREFGERLVTSYSSYSNNDRSWYDQGQYGGTSPGNSPGDSY